ncbi:MAG: pyridoxal phosphate-dependent aminotransferase [Candidatus Altiarchaeales archaeon]|nr:MAG: pyridoxal phosphate-dependent aminotransferase [Candidatus Altiarchaeales archaeon]RLI94392.1 MAG: pyridoxal phosphate-dependent aminotransferase [Candidatus Altiarchaeales archaeon]RLI94616.1 MAG: pyridoxal phosphate-dependent aminotransferase [Candidatus Altiarchaeales archaeon]HDO82612.1 pyridoxal phosphate-dependent aminotransferase [Candidatus Altiarchaeales archaeon]HEX55261.1 pyridoxal phosphate-dependent aminotransferase [Candidatus Altiarchaeales archaeon]
MISKRVSEIPFSGIRRFFELVQKSKDIISLGVGEPDFPTPEPIKDSGIRAIENDYTSYTSNYGLLELRIEIAKKLKKKNNIDRNPENEILITVGVSEALDLAVRAITDPGDEILVLEPCYVSYKPSVWFSYGNPIEVPSTEENEFIPQMEDIEKRTTKRTKAIILCSPNNPTGTVLRKRNLEEIADIAIENDLIVISDEIYEDLIYDNEKHYSIGSLNGMEDRTITLNGFSKVYSMTGWRLGYATANSEIIEAMMKVHQYTMLCAPSIAQYAALDAFKHEKYINEMVRQYDKRRRLLVKGLNSIDGISCVMPKGAFYAFPNIKESGLNSEEFAERLLRDGKVAVVPGNTFGECGEGYIRCSYSVSRDDISEALRRIEEFMRKIK